MVDNKLIQGQGSRTSPVGVFDSESRESIKNAEDYGYLKAQNDARELIVKYVESRDLSAEIRIILLEHICKSIGEMR